MKDYNIRMYPYYYGATSFIAWFPIFFLYFNSILDLKSVLLLEAIYYISVVLLEVPTGYFSDVIGRKKTLVIGAIFLVFACVFFLVGRDFLTLVFGQLCFALHMAMVSGTNTVFHYESLHSAGKTIEYGDREAIAYKYGMIAGGTAALAGGAVATIDLRLAYVVSFIAAMVALFIAIKFREPEKELAEVGARNNMLAQITTTIRYLKIKPLGWLFVYYILFFAISHVPYEFYQPYIQILSENELLYGFSVPIVAGFVYAGARYLGAFGAAYSMQWSRSLGLSAFLIIALLVMQLMVFMMASALHSFIVLLVLFRSLPWAAIKAPINVVITPNIEAGQRATFHSILSLACRLTFFMILLGLSLLVPEDQLTNWPNLRKLLIACVIGAAIMTIPIWITARRQLAAFIR